MNWFELSVKSRANESVPVSLPTIYYSSKLPNQDFSCRFWQLCGAKKKKPIPHPTKLINMPLRGQVVFSVKHLFCGNVKTITCIVDEVLVEEVVQSVFSF